VGAFVFTPFSVNIISVIQAAAVFGHVSFLGSWWWRGDGNANDLRLRVVTVFTTNVFQSVNFLSSLNSPIERSSFTAVIIPLTVFEAITSASRGCAIVVIRAVSSVLWWIGASVCFTLAASLIKTTEV
jgi:hypothetical protein